MKEKPITAAALALFCASLVWPGAGCKSSSPSQYVSPRVEGRVLDSQSHEPIENVRVRRVRSGENPGPGEIRKGGTAMETVSPVRTGPDGAFALDSLRDLAVLRTLAWFSVTVSLEHPAYQKLMTNFSWKIATNAPNGEPLIKAGNIMLQPLSR